jgi:DNA-binding MarR family transcriptional regulator
MQQEYINQSDLKKVRDLLEGMMLSAEDTKNELDRLIKRYRVQKIEDGILKGHSVRQIAKGLNVPKSTVYDHVKRLSR